MQNIATGSIILTRNAGGEERNRSPGFFNHCAIYIGNGQIVEALADEGEVVQHPINNLLDNIAEFKILTPNSDLGKLAAAEARNLVGHKYRKISSVFRNLRRPKRGFNCVSLVRMAYRNALGFDPNWKIPDDLLKSKIF